MCSHMTKPTSTKRSLVYVAAAFHMLFSQPSLFSVIKLKCDETHTAMQMAPFEFVGELFMIFVVAVCSRQHMRPPDAAMQCSSVQTHVALRSIPLYICATCATSETRVCCMGSLRYLWPSDMALAVLLDVWPRIGCECRPLVPSLIPTGCEKVPAIVMDFQFAPYKDSQHDTAGGLSRRQNTFFYRFLFAV